MLKKTNNIKRKDKKGDSIMISYVLLILIAISLWVGIYAWIKIYAKTPSEEPCPDETSVIITNIFCNTNSGGGMPTDFNITIKNNGRFNVSGIFIAIGEDSEKEPSIYPMQWKARNLFLNKNTAGIGIFPFPLSPGSEIQLKFSAISDNVQNNYADLTKINVVKIQPFIYATNKKTRFLCKNAVITEKTRICQN